MSAIERSIEAVRRVHDDRGAKELARRSGVPYTTIREAAQRGFAGKPIETLIALVNAAEEIEAEGVAPPVSHSP